MYLGRKFHSDLSVDECIAHFKALASPEGDESQLFEPRWTCTTKPAPDALLGVRLETGEAQRAMYLGIWAQGYQEMAVVPSEFDPDAPFPLAGRWKMRDTSLKSIGWVTDFAVD